MVLNQRGGIEGEFIEGWEMFREDFWEEEEKLRREEEERVKREGRRPTVQPADIRPGSGRVKALSGTTGAGKKKKGSMSGSVSSVKTGSTSGGSVKEKGGKKKKKRTAEQAVAGI